MTPEFEASSNSDNEAGWGDEQFNSNLQNTLVAEANRINADLVSLSAQERVRYVLQRYPDSLLFLTSGGIQSRLLPTIVSEVAHVHTFAAPKQLLIDTGDLFVEMLAYAKQTANELGLTLFRVAHDFTPGEFKVRLSQEMESGKSLTEAFDYLTKVLVLRGIVAKPELLGLASINALVSGNRRDQAPSRAQLPFAEAKNGLLYFYPIADWSADDVQRFMTEHHVPRHPLHDKGFTSVGNQFDSRPALADATFEKEGRHRGEKTECGLHLWWLDGPREPLGVRLLTTWSECVVSPLPEMH